MSPPYTLIFGIRFFYYAAIKLPAYTTFCLVATPLLGIDRPHIGKAINFGLQRVALGLLLGVFVCLLIFPFFSNTTNLPNSLTYALVFIPFRWVEWAMMENLIQNGEATFRFALMPRTAGTLLWRLMGIIVSFFTDFFLYSKITSSVI